MKKIYMIFFTLILGAMVIPKAQAQITSCGDNLQLVTAADSCKTSSYNFDDPQPPSGSTIGGLTVTYEFILSGATVDTLGTSEGIFNVGTTQIMAVQYVGTTPTDTCYKYADVQDKKAPEIVCQNVTAYLDSNGVVKVGADELILSADDCYPDSVLSYTVAGLDSVSLNCDLVPGLDTTVFVVVEDPDGYADSCEATITVMDTLAPYVECKDTLLYVDEFGDASLLNDALVDSVWENCGIANYELSQTDFTCSDITGSTFTVTTTVTDNSDSTAFCTSNVEVRDTVSPTPYCQDTTIYLDESGAVTLHDDVYLANSSDNCEVDSVRFDDGGVWVESLDFACADTVGVNTVTLKVWDVHENTATCDIEVTVKDTVAPDAECLQYVEVYLDDNGFATITAPDVDDTSTDNCAVVDWMLNADSLNCVGPLDDTGYALNTTWGGDSLYSVGVDMTVVDASGNTDVCMTNVIVRDTIPPVPVCNRDTAYLDSLGVAYTDVDDIAIVTDNASECADDILLEITNGYTGLWSCDDVDPEEQLVTVTATDKAGNDSTCQAVVVVKDTFPPTPVCQDVDVYLDKSGSATITASDIEAGSFDACGIATWELSQDEFRCLMPNRRFDNSSLKSAEQIGPTYPAYPYDTSVDMTVTDVNGNTGTCTSTVTVHDTIAPTPDCQAVTVTLDENGEATVTTPDRDLVPVASINRESPTPPWENGIAGWNSSDNCDPVYKQEVEQTVFTCEHIAYNPEMASDEPHLKAGHLTNTVMLKVWDYAGNTSTCEVPVIVVDDDAPTAMCKDTTLYLDGEGMIDLDLTSDSIKSIFDDGSYDNTDCLTYSVEPLSLSCDDVSEETATTVTLTVTDAGGNTDMCTSNVTVLDTLPPFVEPNDLTIWLKQNGEYALDAAEQAYLANVGMGGTYDNCTADEDLDVTIFPISFECIDAIRGPVPVAITATDEYDNEATANAYVTVIDTFAPVMNCKDTLDVTLDEDGQALIFPGYLNDAQDRASVPNWARTLNDLDGGSYDACGIDSAWVSQGVFTCDDLGAPVETKLWVADPSGNVSWCSTVVNIYDTIAPTISVDADTIEVEVEPGVCETAITYPDAMAMDNCDAELSLVSGVGPDSTFQLGSTTEVWVAIDGSGNVSDTASFVVTVTTTNAPPTLDSIPDVEVMEDAGPVHVDITGISHGIDCVEEDVTVSAEVTSGTDIVMLDSVMYEAGSDSAKLALSLAPDMNGDAMVAVTVVDAAGDTITKTMTVTVVPVNDPPYLVTPIADQVVNASYELKISLSSVLGEYFDDIDGDMLTLTAMLEDGSLLPAWTEVVGDTMVAAPMIADTGCYTVVVEASDGELTATDTFEVCVDGYPTAIDDLGAGEFEVNLYPNPTQGRVNVDIEASTAREIQLTVLDITGKQVLRRQYSAAERITFNMADKVSGMYFVKLDFNGKQVLKKLVVDRR